MKRDKFTINIGASFVHVEIYKIITKALYGIYNKTTGDQSIDVLANYRIITLRQDRHEQQRR